jgi:C-terminal processing protease CtpA/Prc
MSGMELVATGTHLDRFVISRIRENSAASEAGFMAGDLVVSLDNISSEKLSLSKIYSNLNLREGKKINLTVLRKGSYISRTFYLKREI